MRFPCDSTANIIERTPAAGSLFCAKPIRHTMPSEKRQAGQISMSEILEGKLKIEDLSKIRTFLEFQEFGITIISLKYH